MSEKAKRYRSYCFTDFSRDSEFLLALPWSYICWGHEICPSTGRPHYQGFIYLKDAKTESAVRKMFGGRHVEKQYEKATNQDSIDYCKGNHTNHKGVYKPLNEVFEEYGFAPEPQGKRNDILLIHEKIKEGNCTMRDILSSTDTFQTIRIAEINLKYFEKPRNWAPEVFWYYGDTGTNKTKTAYEMCEDPYTCMGSAKWWEGYDGHADVIIDDYRPEFCNFNDLLRILDRYAYRIENKGGTRQLRAKRIFITTPKHPMNTWRDKTDEDISQLLRRITHITYFETKAEIEARLKKEASGV